MTPLTQLRDAAVGWLDLIAGREEAAALFGGSPGALANAVGFYAVAMLATLLLLAVTQGGDGASMTLAIAVAALTLLSLCAVTILSAMALRMPVMPMLVAVTYALAFSRVVRILPLFALATDIGVALLGALGFLFYRAARLVGRQGQLSSTAFAIVAVVALVLPTTALYMLVGGGETSG